MTAESVVATGVLWLPPIACIPALCSACPRMGGLIIFIGSVPETYLRFPGGSVNLRDLAERFLLEGEWLGGQPDRIHAEADKRHAVCDRVLRDGRAKGVAEVRELLEHDWRV